MGIEIKMPALSPTMEEGTLAKWLIKEGDEVVTSGQLKIKNGTPLIIDNTRTPPDEAAPTPQEK